MNTPESLLAAAFPPYHGFRGACTTIRDLNRLGLYPGHLGITPDKASAVRLIVRAGLSSQRAHGNASKAMRRVHSISAARRSSFNAAADRTASVINHIDKTAHL